MRLPRHASAAAAVSILLCACVGPDTGRPPVLVMEPGDTPPVLADRHVGGPECILGVVDAEARVEDIDGGAAIVFTTTTNPSELRARVKNMAQVHGPGAHKGLGHSGSHGSGDQHGLQLWRLPAMHTETVDVPRGEELRVRAVDAGEAPVLRADLRARVTQIEQTPCD